MLNLKYFYGYYLWHLLFLKKLYRIFVLIDSARKRHHVFKKCLGL